MTIGFLHIDSAKSEDARKWATLMVASARKAMPYVPIVQFTDLRTKAIKGVSSVRRKPSEPMGLLRLRHCAGVAGEWVFVDTDVIFQHSVKQVFKRGFDIAVTSRDWGHIRSATGFAERMPFNTGVVFSRCPRFWSEAYTRLRHMDADLQHFMGEQQVICDVAAETDRYNIRKLHGSMYNFPPEVPGRPSAQQLEERAAILHYKGPERKALMLERGARRCA